MNDLVDMIQTATLTLPAAEVTILLVILALCLVFKLSRTGLLASYVIAYRWGWLIVSAHEEKFMVAYLAFGLIVGVLAVISMLKTPT